MKSKTLFHRFIHSVLIYIFWEMVLKNKLGRALENTFLEFMKLVASSNDFFYSSVIIVEKPSKHIIDFPRRY